ncbi:MAG: M23 family metallopeptidase [Elusimicrobiota bacterium]|jgi:hypothetical protein|nr:M23 family metallopeptidase [Elusimicrobiota bacterium]
MTTIKNIFKNKRAQNWLVNCLIYLPLCLFICFIVFFFARRQMLIGEARRKEQNAVYFKKYEGNLKGMLLTSLQNHGLSREQASLITTKLDGVLNMRRLAPRDRYLLTLTPEGEFKMLVITKDFSRYYVAQNGSELVAGIMDISVKTREKFAKGGIESSLFASMEKDGLKPAFIIDFTDIFSWAVDFNTETRSGDKYAVLWREDYTADNQTLNESVLAAYYDGGFTGKTYAIRFEDEFYDQDGKFTKKMFLKSPISVRGARITSRFTNSRLHPVLRYRRAHLGIDYAAPGGTPVESVADGTIIWRGVKGGFGNYMEVRHPNNFVTCYGHLKSFAKNTAVGSKIRQGQTIAYVGNTGLSTGPHLDFRLRQGGKYIDFLNNKNRSSAAREIPKNKREEFNKIKDKYMALLEEHTQTTTPEEVK